MVATGSATLLHRVHLDTLFRGVKSKFFPNRLTTIITRCSYSISGNFKIFSVLNYIKYLVIIFSIPIVYEMIPGAIVTVFLVENDLVSNSLDIGVDNRADSKVFKLLFLTC